VTDALPIVDAHQHFWDPAGGRYPWLSTAPQPAFRYGDYAALRDIGFDVQKGSTLALLGRR